MTSSRNPADLDGPRAARYLVASMDARILLVGTVRCVGCADDDLGTTSQPSSRRILPTIR